MAYEQMGYDGIGGLIVAGLTLLGWKRRLDKRILEYRLRSRGQVSRNTGNLWNWGTR